MFGRSRDDTRSSRRLPPGAGFSTGALDSPAPTSPSDAVPTLPYSPPRTNPRPRATKRASTSFTLKDESPLASPSDRTSFLPAAPSAAWRSASGGRSTLAGGAILPPGLAGSAEELNAPAHWQRERTSSSSHGPDRASLSSASLRVFDVDAAGIGTGESRYSGIGRTSSAFSTDVEMLESGGVASTASHSKRPYSFAGFAPQTRASIASFRSLSGDTKQAMVDASTTEALLWDEKNAETDDFLHNPRPDEFRDGVPARAWSNRGFFNVGAIVLLILVLLSLFMMWPILTYFVHSPSLGNSPGWNYGGINGTGQIPALRNVMDNIDASTPSNVYTKTGADGTTYNLVFSDEFNTPGRTFWPGDDPHWEAVNLHYWQTLDKEWYDPDAITTRDGNLEIEIDMMPVHGLAFRSGMLQSWNKVCFSDNAIIEVNVSLPGTATAQGFWPGLWTQGNLGRAGYGAANDGMWPYSYDSCDAGTMPNQTNADGRTPALAKSSGSRDYGGELSWLVGQRASACTCPGDPHPGPSNNVGRGSPEIDILEAQVDYHGYGTASQSMQIAPFDAGYRWDNLTSAGMTIYNPAITILNEFKGGINQEAASAVTNLDATSYEGRGYQTFSYEYQGGGDSNAHVTWAVGGTPTWRINAAAFKPDSSVDVGQRLISVEPMSININLALSNAFQTIEWAKIAFPATMRVDYVRVWQKPGSPPLSCDPPNYPTAQYIQDHILAYTNPNLTVWGETNYTKARNSRSAQGCN